MLILSVEHISFHGSDAWQQGLGPVGRHADPSIGVGRCSRAQRAKTKTEARISDADRVGEFAPQSQDRSRLVTTFLDSACYTRSGSETPAADGWKRQISTLLLFSFLERTVFLETVLFFYKF